MRWSRGPPGISTRVACLLKAVPDSDAPSIDLEARRVDRAVGGVRTNPFDSRALATALSFRRPGDTITAVTMGPPGSEPVLRDALAAGADQAILLTDAALAGSDALATSRVLARAVQRLSAEVVIAGAFSTDSGTGAVPPMVAGQLGWPVLSHLRSLERRGTGLALGIVRDTRDGFERFELSAPIVLAVGEKIGKPPKPTDAERARAADQTIERWGIAGLDLLPAQVGIEGSPTVVEGLVDHVSRRSPRLFRDGPVDARVSAAFDALGAGEPKPLGDAPAGPGTASLGPPECWVVDTSPGGPPDEEALSILAEIRRVWPDTNTVGCSLAGRATDELLARWARAGAGTAWALDPQADPPRDALSFSRILAHTLRGPAPPAAILFVSDPIGRETAGLLAARAQLGLVGDATGFRSTSDGSIRWEKPSFGGEYLARIAIGTHPHLATIRPGAFAPASRIPDPPPIPVRRFSPDDGPPGPVPSSWGREVDPADGDLGHAALVVCVGTGIGGPEGIRRIRPWLARWGAALGATRRVVDAGWLPVQYQVGLTGRAIAPRLAVLLGVGKAQNHVIGLRRAGRLLAVNPDPEAAVFRYVDAGVVAGWEEALPALDRALSARRDPPLP